MTRREDAGETPGDRAGTQAPADALAARAETRAETLARRLDPARAAELRRLGREAAAWAAAARAPNTRRAYTAAWAAWAAWCDRFGLDPQAAAPETVALHLAEAARARIAGTLRVRLAGIAAGCAAAGHRLDTRHPCLASLIAGVARAAAGRPVRQAAPATPDRLAAMVAALPATVRGLRDRALLLLGEAAALRRSEIAALAEGDVAPRPGLGLEVAVRRGKTDPFGAGAVVAVPRAEDPARCAVRALDAWRACRGPAAPGTPLFRALRKGGAVTTAGLSDRGVARAVRAAAEAAGFADAACFSGHSLRAGFATAASAAGAPLEAIMRQTRHRSAAAALRYCRAEAAWRAASATGSAKPSS